MYGRYASHTNLGYTWKQYQTGLELEMTADGSTDAWPQSDVYVAKTSMEDYLPGRALPCVLHDHQRAHAL